MTTYSLQDIQNKLGQFIAQKKIKTVIESPGEISEYILGTKIISFDINTDAEDAYCNEDEEIHIEFDNGKEMRIFINEEGNLQVYTD